MPGVGWVLLGRIVLEINFWEPALTLREYLVLVDLIILAVLEQYYVKIVILYLADWDIMYVVSPIETSRAPAVAFPLSFR